MLRRIHFSSRHPLLMGVLNVTPDSFSDGGRFLEPRAAVDRGLRMVAEGADILDVGGESTRPGATDVSASAELQRVLPVVEELASRAGVPVSIDTRKPLVARSCIDAGACIINDVGGLRDPEMLAAAAEMGASVVLMHMRGTPGTMQAKPAYEDVVAEIRRYLRSQAQTALRAGVREVAVDPGLGFGKTARHNFEILAGLRSIAELGFPVLVGPSRKSFLGSLPSRLPVGERLEGTLAAIAIAVLNGARVVRVHDIQPCRRVLEVLEAVAEARDAG